MKLKSLLAAVLSLTFGISYSQIVITAGGGTPTVTTNLIGPGLTVSGTPTINCDAGAYGSFSNGLTTNLGVSNGLVMTTGQAALAAGPNNATSDGFCVGTSFSDPQLTALDAQANEDVCIITLNVIPQCNQLTIRFVFGSEEYPEFVSSGYNDAFGFFVSGPNPLGGTYNNFNLAQIPGGGQASIDNVNATTNSAYYVNNAGGLTIEYDAFTTVLTPTINVVPCSTYTFKLAIADAGDCYYDSGVFIDLLSCTNAFTLSTTSTAATCGSNNGTATATVTGGIGPFTYTWSPAPGGGQGTANATGLTGGVTYTVTVHDNGLPCGTNQVSSQTIGSTGGAPTVTVTPTTATVCNGTGTVLTANGATSYTWSPATGLSATTGAVVTATPSTTTTYTVTGTAGCGSGTATTTITVNPIPTTTAGSNSPICAGSALNLTATASGVAGSTYSWTGPNGFTSATQNPSIPAATTAASGTYTVTVTAAGCSSTSTVNVTVNPLPTTTAGSNSPICAGSALNLTATASGVAGSTYSWTGPNGFTSATQNPSIPAATTAATGTYTVTVTAGTCSTTSTVNVTVNATPTTTAGSNSPICAGSALNLTATASGVAGSTYSWTGPNGFTSATQNPSIPAATTAASGTYTVTVTAAGCSSTSTVNVTVNPLPTTTAGSNSPICEGNALNLTATTSGVAGSTYSWTGPNGFTSATQNPSIPAATTAATGTYTVTVTAGTCSTTSTVNVTVNAGPTTTAGSNSPICVGNTLNLTATFTAGATYSWTGPGGFTSAVQNPTIASAATTDAGTYTVTISMAGCTSTSSTTVFVNSTFDATITPAGPFCATDPAVNLTAVDGGGTWTGTGITNGATGTFDPATAGAGTHTITYTIGGSCGDVQTTTITVNAIPTTTAGSNSPVCEGTALNLTATASGVAGSTYSWTGPNGFTSATQNPSVAVTTQADNGVFTVTVSANGCSSTSTTTAVINPIPSTTAGSNSPICEGTQLDLTATNSPVAGTTYSWAGPNGFTSAVQNPNIPAATTAATGTYTVTVTAATCTSTSTVNVTVNPNADATITPAGPFCTTDTPVNLTAVDPGGVWSGNGITNGATGTFDPSVAALGPNTITYTIAGACGDVQTLNITVSNQLDATINPAGPFCASNPAVTLAAVDAGGTWSGPGVDPVTGVFTPSAAGAGNHTITYTLGGSCGDTQTTVIQVFADANATITPAGPFCLTDPAVNLVGAQTGGVWTGTGITNAANGTFDPATANIGTHTITYTINGVCGDAQTTNIVVIDTANTTITAVGPFCIDAPSVTLSAATAGGTWSASCVGCINAATGAFSPSSAGAGTHTITYTIAGNCGNSSTTSVVVNALPVMNFTVDNASGCSPVNATFTNNTPGGTSCTWQINGTNMGASCASFNNVFTVPGCYDITLSTTDGNGCSNSQTIPSMVCVSPDPVADFSFAPTNATIMDPTIDFTNASSNANTYNWDFGGLGTSTATNPSFTFPGVPGTYNVCLEAVSAAGCIDSTCQLVTIYDEFIIYVPNSFTVDGDGLNDIFLPIVSGHDPLSYQLLIFNRWGELIFESYSNQVGWDGMYKGQVAKQDVYVWKVKVRKLNSGDNQEYIGHVTLLR